MQEQREYMERWNPRDALARRVTWVGRALGAAGEQVAKFVPRTNSGLRLPCLGPHDEAVDDEASTSSRALLQERVQLYGLKEIKVKGDGNCQFRALAHQLRGSEADHRIVRELVVDQLRVFGELYREYVPDDYNEYCAVMAKDGEWGDHVTLKAVADVYNTRIVVLTSYEGAVFTEIEPRHEERKRPVLLSFWAEVHYNALQPQDESFWRKQPAS